MAGTFASSRRVEINEPRSSSAASAGALTLAPSSNLKGALVCQPARPFAPSLDQMLRVIERYEELQPSLAARGDVADDGSWGGGGGGGEGEELRRKQLAWR
ncbi:hypothetical protein KSP40_PGU017127 [Platanthera guangdongensis]|uniref:Uncharacterized protein n=1 Tax=Platanthera guangdongensis TaxID=2320717 RepID=A0ABR2MT67_9ASPA